ncbi:MAG: DUF4476 domain-containing protein [Chitinophagaceae bacterium]|nr:DUF4476 domain-containing protein [Chitinophagaceae bacterium]
MKKIILSCGLLVTTLFCLAQIKGNVTISTTGTNNLKIKFGGKQYSLQDRSVTFQSLEPGNYSLIIYQLQQKTTGGTAYTEVFNNNITVNAKKHLEVSVLRFGKIAWDESTIEPDDWANTGYQPVPGQPVGTVNNNGTVSDEQFVLLKKSIKDATYDSDKMITGKVVLKNNLFTAAQIKEMCRLFTYDDNKLEFAKLAYEFCADKGFYITILDVFTYQSTKTSLLEFIKNK